MPCYDQNVTFVLHILLFYLHLYIYVPVMLNICNFVYTGSKNASQNILMTDLFCVCLFWSLKVSVSGKDNGLSTMTWIHVICSGKVVWTNMSMDIFHLMALELIKNIHTDQWVYLHKGMNQNYQNGTGYSECLGIHLKVY